jgi:structural maintenance of chromosome 3 (chondroitin sulfate proteoglycan 6)
MDKLLSQRSLYVSKRDDCMKKIRELGALPNEAFDKYKGLDIKKLMKLLEKTNADLKKMSGVNKKAFDQYSTYMEEKDELLKRKEGTCKQTAGFASLNLHAPRCFFFLCCS